ncbi:MAG: hypothetical protein KA035_01230 [Candidatus Levybacteria bacterium]|nr:hypothetical protein [Candidatus Levybacteria bacterium]
MAEGDFDLENLGEAASVPEGYEENVDHDIADIEHFLKGSGVVVNGKIVNGNMLSQHFEHHGVPARLFEMKEIDEDLNERRAAKELQGVWAPFNMDEIDFDVIMRWSPTVSLNPVGSDRKIPSEWEMWLANTTENGRGEVISNPDEIIEKLPIRPGFEDVFSLQKATRSLPDGKKAPYAKLVINPSKIAQSTTS